MDRRTFLTELGAGAAFAARAQNPPKQQFVEERVERITPPPKPALAINHLGFLPRSKKTVVFRLSGEAPAEFTFRDIGSSPKPPELKRALTRVTSDLGDCLVGDFSDVERPGMYQVTAGTEMSVPFFIGENVWRRTLVKAVGYIHAQRCGTEVPNVHPVCHLDDARRRDTGEHIDTTGGWHDAGDLRKWVSATVLNGIALMELLRNLGDQWDAAGSGAKVLLEEARWGNIYFLKMQDKDGYVWNDVAGGVNGDNSDNHWTDNRIGTPDDRYINTGKSAGVQALFTLFEGHDGQRVPRLRSAPTPSAACRPPCAAGTRPTVSAARATWPGGRSRPSNSTAPPAKPNTATMPSTSVRRSSRCRTRSSPSDRSSCADGFGHRATARSRTTTCSTPRSPPSRCSNWLKRIRTSPRRGTGATP